MGPFGQESLRKAAKNLGVDLSIGARCTRVQSARLKAATKRAPRVKRVRKAGVHITKAAILARAHVVAVAEYGGEVLGWSDTAIQSMRTAMHVAVTPRPSGRSLTADLQFASPGSEFGADPGVRACTSPVFFWLAAIWVL